jgi:predicted transcriptional regulator
MQSTKKANRPRVVMTLDTKLKIIADFEAGKCTVNIRHELGIPPTTVRTIVADKQKYKDVAKLGVCNTIKCLRTREIILLKMENLLLIWISDRQAKGNVNSMLIRGKVKRIFYDLKVDKKNCQTEFFANKGWFEKFK